MMVLDTEFDITQKNFNDILSQKIKITVLKKREKIPDMVLKHIFYI